MGRQGNPRPPSPTFPAHHMHQSGSGYALSPHSFFRGKQSSKVRAGDTSLAYYTSLPCHPDPSLEEPAAPHSPFDGTGPLPHPATPDVLSEVRNRYTCRVDSDAGMWTNPEQFRDIGSRFANGTDPDFHAFSAPAEEEDIVLNHQGGRQVQFNLSASTIKIPTPPPIENRPTRVGSQNESFRNTSLSDLPNVLLSDWPLIPNPPWTYPDGLHHDIVASNPDVLAHSTSRGGASTSSLKELRPSSHVSSSHSTLLDQVSSPARNAQAHSLGTLSPINHRSQPRIGPSRDWEIRPKPKRGRKPAPPSEKGISRHFKNASRVARNNRSLSPRTKQHVSRFRNDGWACRRCHYKKCKCNRDPFKPDQACQNCPRPALCFRYSITDVVLYRQQVAPHQCLSKRWNAMELVDMTDWASEDIRVIEISQIFVHAPYRLQVRRFIPREGDMLEERWNDGGATRRYPVPPYAIVDMEEAARSIDGMIVHNQQKYLHALIQPQSGSDFFWQTYRFAFQSINDIQDENARLLIYQAFRLWVACRLTSYPTSIVGQDTLGMRSRVTDPTSPWDGKFPTPPVLNAQLECILHTRFLRPLGSEIRKLLDKLMEKRSPEVFLAIYFTLFILLHSCSMLANRDRLYAAQLGLGTEYCNPEAISSLRRSAITLLYHFHGVFGGPVPFRLAFERRLQKRKRNAAFTAQQEDFMAATYIQTNMRRKFFSETRETGDFCNEWYWVSQLYDESWEPDRMD